MGNAMIGGGVSGDSWGCGLCVEACPKDALKVVLR